MTFPARLIKMGTSFAGAGAPPSYLGSLPTEANATVTPMGPVEAVRFSANNKMMTVGCSDGVVYTWDLKTQVCVVRILSALADVTGYCGIARYNQHCQSSGALPPLLLRATTASSYACYQAGMCIARTWGTMSLGCWCLLEQHPRPVPVGMQPCPKGHP
jgi:WD40 repeat protein